MSQCYYAKKVHLAYARMIKDGTITDTDLVERIMRADEIILRDYDFVDESKIDEVNLKCEICLCYVYNSHGKDTHCFNPTIECGGCKMKCHMVCRKFWSVYTGTYTCPGCLDGSLITRNMDEGEGQSTTTSCTQEEHRTPLTPVINLDLRRKRTRPKKKRGKSVVKVSPDAFTRKRRKCTMLRKKGAYNIF